jgi:Uncharacterised nucleotidyltransferase
LTKRRQAGDAPALLLAAIADPSTLRTLQTAQWEVLLTCARRNAVLAYLAERTFAARILEQLPELPVQHMLSARTSAARLAQLARWELDRVERVLRANRIPVIALKGVAYLLRNMPHARTRLISDVDIMVPRDRLDEAEGALLESGWQFVAQSEYDRHYYRTWSHELPPLLYPGRLLAVDVHHTLCPPVSRMRPDPQRFWADAVTIREANVQVLSPVDSVLHAAVHLFFDSDFDGRFRDLLDLHEMLLALGSDESAWASLVERAGEHGFGRPVYYAMETLRAILGTPIPLPVMREIGAFRPPAPLARWMRNTLVAVMTPIDPERWPPEYRARRWLLFVRSHWLRMPARLLFPHLARKSLRRVAAARSGHSDNNIASRVDR